MNIGKAFVLIFVGALIGISVGNHQGDQNTLRDCATKGTALMLGGGTIKCDVVRVTKP